MALTLERATKAVDAAIAEANSIGVSLSIAVVDQRGDLVAVARMDGAKFFTPEVARGKAQVSAVFGAPSGSFGDRASSPIFDKIGSIIGGNMLFAQGGMPILENDRPIGAIGCSGGSGEQDEQAARAGAVAV